MGFYRVGQKLSDVIPVLQITPIATEPSTVSVCSERRQVRSNHGRNPRGGQGGTIPPKFWVGGTT